jgi:hypothetical protein
VDISIPEDIPEDRFKSDTWLVCENELQNITALTGSTVAIALDFGQFTAFLERIWLRNNSSHR